MHRNQVNAQSNVEHRTNTNSRGSINQTTKIPNETSRPALPCRTRNQQRMLPKMLSKCPNMTIQLPIYQNAKLNPSNNQTKRGESKKKTTPSCRMLTRVNKNQPKTKNQGNREGGKAKGDKFSHHRIEAD